MVNGIKETVVQCLHCHFAIRESQLRNPQTPTCQWIDGEICPFCLNTDKQICTGLGETVKKYRVGRMSNKSSNALLDVCSTLDTHLYFQVKLTSLIPTCQKKRVDMQEMLQTWLVKNSSEFKIQFLTKGMKQVKSKLYKDFHKEIQLLIKTNTLSPTPLTFKVFEEKSKKLLEFLSCRGGCFFAGDYSDLRFLQSIEGYRLFNSVTSMTVNCLLSQWTTRLINQILESFVFVLISKETTLTFGTTLNDLVYWLSFLEKNQSTNNGEIWVSQFARNTSVFFNEQLRQITSPTWKQIAKIDLTSFRKFALEQGSQKTSSKQVESKAEFPSFQPKSYTFSNEKKTKIRHLMMKKLRKCQLCQDFLLDDLRHCVKCCRFLEGKYQFNPKEKQKQITPESLDCKLCQKQVRYRSRIEELKQWVQMNLEKERVVHKERKTLYEEAYVQYEVLIKKTFYEDLAKYEVFKKETEQQGPQSLRKKEDHVASSNKLLTDDVSSGTSIQEVILKNTLKEGCDEKKKSLFDEIFKQQTLFQEEPTVEEQRIKHQVLPIDLLKELMFKAPFGTLDDLKACLFFPEIRSLIPILKWVKWVDDDHQGMGGFQYKKDLVKDEVTNNEIDYLDRGLNWGHLNGLLKWKEFYGNRRNIVCIGNLTSDPLDHLKISFKKQLFVVKQMDVVEFIPF